MVDQPWARYIEKVHVGGPEDCHLWIAATNIHGYGIFRHQGQMRLSHRWMFQWVNRISLPRHVLVRHDCDTPACQNIRHLRLGTQADNMRDMAERGRAPSHVGVSNPRTGLTEEQAVQIFLDQSPTVDIAQRYGLCRQSVRNIKRGLTWAQVTGVSE